jgi:hypothetical protein
VSALGSLYFLSQQNLQTDRRLISARCSAIVDYAQSAALGAVALRSSVPSDEKRYPREKRLVPIDVTYCFYW